MGFPFTIEDEAKLLPLKNARLTGGTIYADCPFCGSKGALHISVNKNMWNCCACMTRGEMCIRDRNDTARLIRNLKIVHSSTLNIQTRLFL